MKVWRTQCPGVRWVIWGGETMWCVENGAKRKKWELRGRLTSDSEQTWQQCELVPSYCYWQITTNLVTYKSTDLLSCHSEGQKSKVGLTGWNQGVSWAAFLLEVLGKNLFLCLFQLLEATRIPWLRASSSVWQVPHSRPCSCPCPLSELDPPAFVLQRPLWLPWGHPSNPE